MLTDIEVKAAKAFDKPRKLFDSSSLFLLVSLGANGETHKKWRYKFVFQKKAKLLALGVYPAVSLAEARRRRDKARALLDEGIDPTAQRKNVKREASLRLADTFAGLANDWFQTKQDGWSPRYASDTRKFVDRELIPEFGGQPVSEITPRDLLAIIRKIERRDAPAVAEKVLNIGGQIFRHGVRTGLLASDPSRDLRGALKSREVRHRTRFRPNGLRCTSALRCLRHAFYRRQLGTPLANSATETGGGRYGTRLHDGSAGTAAIRAAAAFHPPRSKMP